MDIKAESSPKIVKKGDAFDFHVKATNDSDDEVVLESFNIELPPGFHIVKSNFKGMPFREILRKAINAKLPPEFDIDTEIPRPVKQLVQPHSSHTEVFEVKAGWSGSPFRPRPETYKVLVSVRYKIGDKSFSTSTTTDLSLFPSFGSMLSGTLAGSSLGTIVKNADIISKMQIPTAIDTQAAFVAQILTIFVIPLIFGLIAGLILTRKKDVQPFLTIEDFWGGIVVGFVVGYQGSDILTQLLPTSLDSA